MTNQKKQTSGEYLSTFGGRSPAQGGLERSEGIAIAPDGSIFVAASRQEQKQRDQECMNENPSAHRMAKTASSPRPKPFPQADAPRAAIPCRKRP
jgi:hypothetical protein